MDDLETRCAKAAAKADGTVDEDLNDSTVIGLTSSYRVEARRFLAMLGVAKSIEHFLGEPDRVIGSTERVIVRTPNPLTFASPNTGAVQLLYTELCQRFRQAHQEAGNNKPNGDLTCLDAVLSYFEKAWPREIEAARRKEEAS